MGVLIIFQTNICFYYTIEVLPTIKIELFLEESADNVDIDRLQLLIDDIDVIHNFVKLFLSIKFFSVKKSSSCSLIIMLIRHIYH